MLTSPEPETATHHREGAIYEGLGADGYFRLPPRESNLQYHPGITPSVPFDPIRSLPPRIRSGMQAIPSLPQAPVPAAP